MRERLIIHYLCCVTYNWGGGDVMCNWQILSFLYDLRVLCRFVRISLLFCAQYVARRSEGSGKKNEEADSSKGISFGEIFFLQK